MQFCVSEITVGSCSMSLHLSLELLARGIHSKAGGYKEDSQDKPELQQTIYHHNLTNKCNSPFT
jgi:hypothetical protein